MESAVAVTARTLEETLEGLARFTGEGPGVTRLVYDAAWRNAHRWLRERGAALGLAAIPDAAGNLYFHDRAVKPGDAPALFVGSTWTRSCTAGASTAPTARSPEC